MFPWRLIQHTPCHRRRSDPRENAPCRVRMERGHRSRARKFWPECGKIRVQTGADWCSVLANDPAGRACLDARTAPEVRHERVDVDVAANLIAALLEHGEAIASGNEEV